MRIEFSDLIESNETLANGLCTLASIVEFVEQRGDAEELYGLADLIKLIGRAGQQQTHCMSVIFKTLDEQYGE